MKAKHNTQYHLDYFSLKRLIKVESIMVMNTIAERFVLSLSQDPLSWHHLAAVGGG